MKLIQEGNNKDTFIEDYLRNLLGVTRSPEEEQWWEDVESGKILHGQGIIRIADEYTKKFRRVTLE